MTAPLITAVVALTALVLAARRAPLATMLAVCGLGAAVNLGAVSLPSALTAPVARASAAVRAWQASQSAKLTCDIAQSRALDAGDVAQLARAQAACGTP